MARKRKLTIGEVIERLRNQAEELEKKAFVPMGPAAADPAMMDPTMAALGGAMPPAPAPPPPGAGAAMGAPVPPPDMGAGAGMPAGVPPELLGMGAGPIPPDMGAGGGATSPEDQIRKVVQEELDRAGVKRKKLDQDEVLMKILELLRAIATALNIPVPEDTASLGQPQGGAEGEKERTPVGPEQKTAADAGALSRSLHRHSEQAAAVLERVRKHLGGGRA